MLTPSSGTAPLTAAPYRVHALDATRGFALLIGIVYHGLESLVANKIYGPAQDTQSSLLLEAAYYVFHIFRMQVFFLMAGYFAHLLYHRQGLRGFVANRVQRLGLPLLIFWPLDYVLVAALWVWSIQHSSGLPLRQAFAKLPAVYRLVQGVPLMHLWFLYYLLLFCACVAVVRPAANRWPGALHQARTLADQALASALAHWWGSLALAVLAVPPMLAMTDGLGVDTPESSLWPRWAPFALYFLYFALGWLLHRQAHLLNALRQFRVVNLVSSGLLIGLLFGLKILGHRLDATTASRLPAAINFVYAFASTTTVCAFVGYMLAYFSAPHPVVRYLSDAAYWGYLIHLPIIIFFQLLVAPYGWHWPIKLLLILGPTFIILLLTYHFCVRHTRLGLLLNGRIYAPRGATA
ncbi:acyltransferase family protein [Hymenobacter sp. PAMC 26628]|uniref:acyltransferase family protein n=1 Tax=Hymenobacter sp. PAMC 26628 TaxID=1484118 RepID=UPI0007705A81|nr:acyltransferase family protein [Hymenobacter sp. PAMC 26628]AMJ65098.1 hypothetical protein AXW84_06415 [Hymenobacter sp. PAMC 26628]